MICLCFISVMNFNLYVRCFDSLMSRGPLRGPNNFYVYVPTTEPRVRLPERKIVLSPSVIYYWRFQGDASVVVYCNCQCLSAFYLSLTY